MTATYTTGPAAHFLTRGIFKGATILLLVCLLDVSFGACWIQPDDITGHVTIPASSTTIPNGAFYNCQLLQTIDIHDAVTQIGDGAFRNAGNLKGVNLPKSVEAIGREAFQSTDKMAYFSIEEGSRLRTIGKLAFEQAKSLENFVMPPSVTEVGSSAFYAASGLKNLTISTSLTVVPYEICLECTSLGSITIPSSVTNISESAFESAISLTSLTIEGDNLKAIEKEAFKYSNITSLILPDSVSFIGTFAFQDCKHLKSVHLPNNPNMIFDDERTRGILKRAGITNLTIPDRWTKIPDYFCQECKQLERLIIGSGVKLIGFVSFTLCTSLGVDRYPLIIPDNVEVIQYGAFSVTEINALVIGKGVKDIYSYAFGNLPHDFHTLTLNCKEVNIHTEAFGGGANLQLRQIKFLRKIRIVNWASFSVMVTDEDAANDDDYKDITQNLWQPIKCNGTMDDDTTMCGCGDGLGVTDTSGDYFVCVPCSPGFRSNPAEVQGSCIPCERGYYSTGFTSGGTQSALAECQACPAGKYGKYFEARSESWCDDCPVGRYNTGGSGLSQCTECPPGRFCNETGMTSWNECVAGTYQLNERSASCDPCAPGSYQPKEGTAFCIPCTAGKFSSIGQSNSSASCTACPRGTYTPDGASACIECGNKLTSNNENTKCVAINTEASVEEVLEDGKTAWGGAIAVALAYLALASVMTVMRERNPDKLANYSRLEAVSNSLLSGFGLGTELFVIVDMWGGGGKKQAIAVLVFRLFHVLGGTLLTFTLFGPRRHVKEIDKWLPGAAMVHSLLEMSFTEGNVYLVEALVIFSMCEVTMFQFIPWKKSSFYKKSEGYPSMLVMKLCMTIKSAQSLVSMICEISYLSSQGTGDDYLQKYLFIANIITGAIAVIMDVSVLTLRGSILRDHEEEKREEDPNPPGFIDRATIDVAVVEMSATGARGPSILPMPQPVLSPLRSSPPKPQPVSSLLPPPSSPPPTVDEMELGDLYGDKDRVSSSEESGYDSVPGLSSNPLHSNGGRKSSLTLIYNQKEELRARVEELERVNARQKEEIETLKRPQASDERTL